MNKKFFSIDPEKLPKLFRLKDLLLTIRNKDIFIKVFKAKYDEDKQEDIEYEVGEDCEGYEDDWEELDYEDEDEKNYEDYFVVNLDIGPLQNDEDEETYGFMIYITKDAEVVFTPRID